MTTREDAVKRLARSVGFDLVGIAGVDPHERSNRVNERWLDEGRHGEMGWLAGRHREIRRDPRRLLDGAKSAICVGVNYYHDVERDQRSADPRDGRGIFSIYVHNEDYHTVVGRMLDDLSKQLQAEFPEARTVACVDTMPVSDRAMAIRSGIAWLGKNTSAISPEFGSWVFLGELITTLALEPDPPLETLCGSCTLCIDACPTGALEPFAIDARRCISYLTIEKRGAIPSELHDKIGVHVYGCDTCQGVCPFNDIARESIVFRRDRRSPIVDMSLDEQLTLSDEEFCEATESSAIRRCRPQGIRRNAAIVKANATSERGDRS